MIHFDFTVSDVDAENIMDCIQQNINRLNENILDEMDKGKKDLIPIIKDSITYYEFLKQKMKNTRVEE